MKIRIANSLSVTVIAVCGLAHIAYGEDYDYTQKDFSIIKPPSTVCHFFDFKEYEVDNFRGIPSISLPVFTIRNGAIEVPIVLSYHGGGIRTKQRNGNAGLGWTLSYGADIVHNVVGAPDDANKSSTIHGLHHLNADEKAFRTNLIEKDDDYDPTDAVIVESKFSWQATLGKRYYQGLTDVANDTYALFGLGFSADFAFTPERKIVISSPSPIEISRSDRYPAITDGGCDVYGFLVNKPDGLSYYFSVQDRTRYDYSYSNPQNELFPDSIYYASAWHLDEIRDLNGNSVKYFYKSLSTHTEIDHGFGMIQYVSVNEHNEQERKYISSLKSTIHYPKIIDRIETSGIKVKFYYLFEVETSGYVPLLDKIRIEADDGTSREIKFTYRGKMLKRIVCQDEEIYSFEYCDDNFRSYNYAQDFGGYNNGQINDNLIPPVDFANYGGIADRCVYPDYAKKGILTKINYPTGGYTEFDWESNSIEKSGTTSFPGCTGNGKIVKSVHRDTLRMCYDEAYKQLEISDWSFAEDQEVTIDLSKYLLMNPANYDTDDYNSYHHYRNEDYPFNNPYNYPHVRFVNSTTNAVDLVLFIDKETIEENEWPMSLRNYLSARTKYKVELVNPASINGAEEFIRLNMLYGDSQSGKIYLDKINYDKTTSLGNNYWPGLRIRTIKSSTGDDNDTPIYKSFYYEHDFAPNKTSGVVRFLPQYNYMFYRFAAIQNGPSGFSPYEVNCVGSTAFPSSSVGITSDIEYPRVCWRLTKEDREEPSSLVSRTESYTYSSAEDRDCYDYNFNNFLSFQPIGARVYSSRAFKRGNLLSKTTGIYMAPGKKTVNYTYNIYEDYDAPLLTTDAFTVCDFTRTAYPRKLYYDYGIGLYKIIPYNKTVNTVTTIEDSVETTEKYTYFYNDYTDHTDYNLVKSKTVDDSEYGEITTYYTYPSVKNKFKPVPETEVVLNGNAVISAIRTEYDTLTMQPVCVYEVNESVDTTGLVSSTMATNATQFSAINTKTYEYRYNSRGNLIEIKYKGRPLASYLWGYYGQYPVIEALDTDYDSLVSSALSAGISPTAIDDCSIFRQADVTSLTSKLRSSLKDTVISSVAYHWLFGIIEMNNGRNISTSYIYDDNGRLTQVKDFNNYLISRHEYKYKINPNHETDTED